MADEPKQEESVEQSVSDNSKPQNLKSWGNRAFDGHEEKVALGAELLAGAFAMQYLVGSALENLCQSAHSVRHAANTVSDSVQGGPEGMRAALDLEKAMHLVEKAARTNKEAAKALENYRVQTKSFAEQLLTTYKENEILKREALRFSVQIRGAYKHFSEFLGDLKPNAWKEHIDVPAYIAYGKVMQALGREGWQGLTSDQIVAKVIDNSTNMKNFYKRMNDFYGAREKNEQTVSNFCTYLEKVQTKADKENKQLEELFPEVIATLNKTYEVEDEIIATDAKGSNMTRTDVVSVDNSVNGYRKDVDNTRAEVGTVVPLEPYYEGGAWIDFVMNPLTVGVAAVLLFKGLRKAMLPNFVDNAVSKGIVYPLKLLGNSANLLYSKVHNYCRKGEKSD